MKAVLVLLDGEERALRLTGDGTPHRRIKAALEALRGGTVMATAGGRVLHASCCVPRVIGVWKYEGDITHAD